MTNDFDSIASADVIFVIGSNTTETHPVVGSLIKQRAREGASLIVCDPRKTEIASRADIHIQHLIGSDAALINAMAQVIIEENLHDAAFVAERTENFEALRETVAAYTPERAAEITCVPADEIRRAARTYAAAGNAAVFYTMGITQHTTGTNNVRALCNLALLCGMFGRPGTGVNPLRGQNNVQGSCDMGALPDMLPGYMKVTDSDAPAKVKSLWGCELPRTPGLSIAPMLAAAASGRLSAMYIMGENPMVTDADSAHVGKALDNLDFLVVQDIFLTETAQKADVVLPAACWAEKDGTFTNTCRGVQRVRKGVSPPGEARPDWQIIIGTAKALGADWTFESPEDIFEDIRRFVPSYAGISHGRIDENEGSPLQWPCPHEGHPGTPILHVGKFARAGGRARFLPVEWMAPHEWTDDAYPLLATTGRSLYHYHSGSMTRRAAPGKFIDRLYIEINPRDATALGIRENDRVRVTSRRGSVSGEAQITERVPPGLVFIPFHFAEEGANNLTAAVWDETSQTPPFKVSAVRVVRATAPPQ